MSNPAPTDFIDGYTAIADAYGWGGDERDDFVELCDQLGFRVVPIPDDTTRAEVEALVPRLRDPYAAWMDGDELHRAGGLLAAAYLDGQTQDRPDRCPTCSSDDPGLRLAVKRPEVRIEGGARVCRFCNRTLTFNFMRNDGGDCDCPRAVEDAACPDPWHVGGSGDTR